MQLQTPLPTETMVLAGACGHWGWLFRVAVGRGQILIFGWPRHEGRLINSLMVASLSLAWLLYLSHGFSLSPLLASLSLLSLSPLYHEIKKLVFVSRQREISNSLSLSSLSSLRTFLLHANSLSSFTCKVRQSTIQRKRPYHVLRCRCHERPSRCDRQRLPRHE